MSTDLETMVDNVARLRAELAEGADCFKTFERALKEKIEAAEIALIDWMTANGLDTISASGMTCFTKVAPQYQCTDWDAFYKCVDRDGLAELMQKRLSKGGIEEYVKAMGKLPDGVVMAQRKTLNMRKATKTN